MNYDLIVDPCQCCGRTLGTFHILKTNNCGDGKKIVLMQGSDDTYSDNREILYEAFGYDYEDMVIKNKNDLLKNLERLLKKYPNSYIQRDDGNKFDLNYIKYLFKISNKTEAKNYYLKYYINSDCADYQLNDSLVNNYLVINSYFS